MIIITFLNKEKKNKLKKLISIEEKKSTQCFGSNLVYKLDERLKKLEAAVDMLSKKKPDYQINIDKLEMHNPQLKELTFRLDQLDIKELSGALNMGNNFGVKVDKKTAPEMDKKRSSMDCPPSK